MNYEGMSDKQVNKAVGEIRHLYCFQLDSKGDGVFISRSTDKYDFTEIVNSNFDPCNNPSDAWPIIVENKIAILPNAQGTWLSYGWKKWDGKQDFSPRKEAIDNNPLRAAMICFLKMKDAEK